MGVCAGAVYVLGFTILQENVEDELRGRIFATLYTLSRLCLLISLAPGAPAGRPPRRAVHRRPRAARSRLGGATIGLPGVRLTLWIGAAIILVAGVLALRTLKSEPDSPQGNE